MTPLDKDIVQKVIDVVKVGGLVAGMGEPSPGYMCVEAAVCYAYGLPHSDEPPCVGRAVRSLKIKANDSDWSNNIARSNGMIRLAVAQLGSVEIDQVEFSKAVAEMTIRKILPIALRSAGLNAEADRCEAEGTYEAAQDAAYNAYAADYAAIAAYYAADAAACAANAAARAADYAAFAARDAAFAARDAAGYDSYDTDKILALFCEEVVQILIQMKSPGCEYLYLIEESK